MWSNLPSVCLHWTQHLALWRYESKSYLFHGHLLPRTLVYRLTVKWAGTSLCARIHQRLHFLRRLRLFGVSRNIMCVPTLNTRLLEHFTAFLLMPPSNMCKKSDKASVLVWKRKRGHFAARLSTEGYIFGLLKIQTYIVQLDKWSCSRLKLDIKVFSATWRLCYLLWFQGQFRNSPGAGQGQAGAGRLPGQFKEGADEGGLPGAHAGAEGRSTLLFAVTQDERRVLTRVSCLTEQGDRGAD